MVGPKPTGLLGTSHCCFSSFKLTKMIQVFPQLFARYTKIGITPLPCCCPAASSQMTTFSPPKRPCGFQLFWVTSKNRQKKSNENIPFHVWLHSLECYSTPVKARINTLAQQAQPGLSQPKLYYRGTAAVCMSLTSSFLKKIGRNSVTNFTTSKIKMQ